MIDTVDWITRHALTLWVLLLVLAVVAGDMTWRGTQRRRLAAGDATRSRHRRRRTAGLLLAALVALFALLAWAIDAPTPGEVLTFDAALATGLHAHLSLPALRVIAVLTRLGDLAWVAAASIVVLLVLLWRRQHQLATWWTLAVVGIVPLNSALKVLFRRARPLYDHALISESSFSFPSGHAFGAIVFYGMLAYVLVRLLPAHFHRAVIGASVSMVCLIGVSRVLLQVHFASDVLGGFTSGAVWLVICIAMAEHWRERSLPAASDPN
ncbi:MAG: phosphatase PAP2 family protein [Rhodanobacter sp.]